MRVLIFSMLVLMSFNALSQQVDIQGHRGARGMMPENTILAFIYALEQGVTTLELDVVISKDGQVVVSHEPWLSHSICLQPDGSEIKESEEKSFNMYQLNYDQIKQYDCGSKGNSRFPDQEKQSAAKPLLSDVIKAVEKHIKSYTQYEVDYNIELKSNPKGDDNFHPKPEEFSKIVYELIDQYLPWERIVIQSFDFRVLKYWHANYPEVRLAALIENLKSIDSNIKSLGFKPHIFSPNHRLLTKKKVEKLHEDGIKVIPWTVNDVDTMQKLINWGVDGIITDYPNKAADAGLITKYSD